MSKPKKSSKSAKIPQPIKVKKEKTEEDRAIHSMAHYVDDRLELVKQIFGSLKTKTITNLAPEYLKEKEMEEIQELCLNELLCLSKKRLLSIINATKCPTDTESSDEDSDVEAKEEHVSLEEISSDSEIENGGKATKKSSSRAKKDGKKPNQTDKAEPQGQMSVLELLELQARARAIRSQLALEPVTKIEVDSDDEQPESTKVRKNTEESSKKSHSKRADKQKPSSKEKPTTKSSSSKTVETINQATNHEVINVSGSDENQISKQKIKIKRNFRNSNKVETESHENQANHSLEDIKSSVSEKVKIEKRSPSPDVIPILADPEVLSISDTSSDEKEQKNTKKKLEERPPKPAAINEETEDGEIVETAEEEENTDKNENQNDTVEKSEKVNKENNNGNSIDADRKPAASLDEETARNKATEASLNDSTLQETADKSASNAVQTSVLNENDGDHSDDVISIEGGDLENEMSEHLDEDNSSKHSGQSGAAQAASSSNDVDIVSLDSSGNEADEPRKERDSESWQSRYMRSSKVNKVLAVSRLGKRVRDKLKTSKTSNKDLKSDKDDRAKPSSKYTSKHEDGSVDQYRELIQMSQRKN